MHARPPKRTHPCSARSFALAASLAALFAAPACGGGGDAPLPADSGDGASSDAGLPPEDAGASPDAGYTGPRPLPPVITEPLRDGQLVNGADVHMETGPMRHPDPSREHRCTDWAIWRPAREERVWFAPCLAGVERVHAHLGDGAFEGSLAGRRALPPEEDFVLSVRHRDDGGHPEGEWSEPAERRFRTRPEREPLPGAPAWNVLQEGFVVEEVAGDLQLPVNIAFVPDPSGDADEPLFYVTELYGTIKVVTGDYRVSDYATGVLNYDPLGNFPGAGEQGLTGLVVDPANGDVIASLLHAAGGSHHPRVVRFISEDGGRTAARSTVLLDMPGEVQGASHQISALSIGPDGHLYVHMGDGFAVEAARDLDSLRGKILRVRLDGTPPPDNPFYDASDGLSARDYVFASGFRNPFGGAWRASDGALYSVENGPAVDRLIRVDAGRDYGWDGTDESMRTEALYLWEPSTAPVNITFVEASRFHGSRFPAAWEGTAFVSESGPTYALGPQHLGKRISAFVIAPDGRSVTGPTTLLEYNGTGASTIAALAAGPDGLYFSDLYPEDPERGPADRGARILRVRWAPEPGTEP